MRTNMGFTLMEMLFVMMIIALAYGMMLPRLSFDAKQTQPQLITAIKEQYNEVRKQGTKILLFMDDRQLMMQQEGQQLQVLLKRKNVETWLLNGERPESAQLISILNPDGTMTPATLQYLCGNRQYSINLTAFRGIHSKGRETSGEEDALCSL